jgi:Uma2 family endonuclease
MVKVKTVVLGERPPEVEAYLKRRHALGQDMFDEIWEGVYHVAPMAHPWHGYLDNVLAELLGPYTRQGGLVGTGPFNLGEADDFRVPDRAYNRALPSEVYVPTAEIVVEVVSRDDETWEKFDFYARRDVDEICTAEPVEGRLRWWRLAGKNHVETDASELLAVTVAELDALIDWPH